MRLKRIFGALLAALLVAEAPGLAGYQAFAVDLNGPEGAKIPETPTLTPVGAQSLNLNPTVNVENVPLQTVIPASELPQVQTGVEAAAQTAQAQTQQTTKTAQAQPQTTAKASAQVQTLSQNPDVKAAVDSERQAGQAPALQKVYDNVGPGSADRAVFTRAEGPVFNIRYEPANRLKRSSRRPADGRKQVFLTVGTGADYHREWAGQWVGKSVAEIGRGEMPGLTNVVIDRKENRPQGVEHFIEADILDLSDENRARVSQKVVDYLNEHGMVAMGAASVIQGYIRMAAVVQEAVRDSGNNPDILVNPYKAIEATTNKFETRQIVGEHVEKLNWPSVVPGSIDEADIEDKSAAAFREIMATGKVTSGEVVVKLVTGAGKAGQVMEGLDSEEAVRKAVRKVIHDINTYWAEHPEKRSIYIESDKNGPPQILIEGKIDRLAEVDVEFSVSPLEDGTYDIQGFIIGNPAPGEKEKGYLFGMNGLLSPELQRAALLAAVESIRAIWRHFEGVPFGGFHVEMIFRADPRDPKVALVEINARPGGGNIARIAKEWHQEIDLISGVVRAALGLAQKVVTRQAEDSLVLLAHSPLATGTVTRIQTPEGVKLGKLSDFGTGDALSKDGSPLYIQAVDVGEKVDGPDQVQTGVVAGVAARGQGAMAAVRSAHGALNRTEHDIELADKTIFKQKGSDEHTEADYRALPEETKDELGLTSKARRELDNYEEAQMRWTPIFRVYGPLFSALMNAMGGLAAIGIGRMGYTLALFVSSPFASVLSSRISVRNVLKYTWAGRIAVWALLVPAAVLLIPSGAVAFTLPVLGWNVSWLMAALFGLNFMDGLLVSLSHPVDWDAFGMDELAKQNEFQKQMTGDVRGHYNARFSAWSAKSMMIFPLAVAGLITGLAALAVPMTWAFVAGMAGVFLWQGGRAIRSVNKLSTDVTMPKPERGVWREFKGGVSIIRHDKKLLGLVSLDSLERALVDALFMVAFPLLGLFAIKPALGLDNAGANLAATVLISIMSYAAMKASPVFRERFKKLKAANPEASEHSLLRRFFPLMFVAGLTTLTIPLAYVMMSAGHIALSLAGLLVAALGTVAFMTAFKPAQIGVMGMMQGAGSAHAGSTRIAGISSAIQMLVSGVVVWALESVFPEIPKTGPIPSAGLPFLIVALFCMAVGAAYWYVWPKLTSKEPAKKA